MFMYLDLIQLARLLYSVFSLFIAWHLSQPWAISLYSKLEFPGWVQVSLFLISAGMLFPKNRRFDWNRDRDVMQVRRGLFMSGLALAASFLP
jgi:hypothetical protein